MKKKKKEEQDSLHVLKEKKKEKDKKGENKDFFVCVFCTKPIHIFNKKYSILFNMYSYNACSNGGGSPAPVSISNKYIFKYQIQRYICLESVPGFVCFVLVGTKCQFVKLTPSPHIFA